MCGITGYYSINNSFSEEDIKKMNNALSHRGPDADGFFISENIALAHRRLSIIDLSKEANQPMTIHDGRYTIVFNGEIYNFREIASELSITFKTKSDTEVLLEAFRKWGVEMVHRLNGMFVFAIFDKFSKKIFLFRDRIGIKPLYYYNKNGDIAFASELKSLLIVSKIRSNLTLNNPAISNFFHLGYIPEPQSVYTEIHKFPAGHYGIIDETGLHLQAYWLAEEKIKSEPLTDINHVKEQAKYLIESAVKMRLISDVPYGTFLSGGIDSSLVTAVAAKVNNEQIKTFTIRFEDATYNEADFAKKIADYLNTNHHEYTVTYADALKLIPELPGIYDEPYADSSAIPTMLVSKLARQNVTMTLSGDGGDELFHGYGAYNWASRLANPFIDNFRKPIASVLSVLGNRLQRASKVFEYENQNSVKSHIFSQEQYLFSTNDLRNLFNKNFTHFPQIKENWNFERKLKPAEAQAFFDLKYYLKDDLLVKVDRASMNYSLETRVPLLDYRLVEFALNIDPSLKIKNGIQKYILKEILYDYVPQEFFNRPKWGFSIPLKKWLANELNYMLEETLSEKNIQKTGILNIDTINELKKQYLSGKDYLYNKLWACIVFTNWFLKHHE